MCNRASPQQRHSVHLSDLRDVCRPARTAKTTGKWQHRRDMLALTQAEMSGRRRKENRACYSKQWRKKKRFHAKKDFFDPQLSPAVRLGALTQIKQFPGPLPVLISVVSCPHPRKAKLNDRHN